MDSETSVECSTRIDDGRYESASGVSTPKVSIGMPVYNGESFIREALDSLLAQTFTDFELIISDNASTDSTQSICREFAEKDKRVRYVQQTENRGATVNFKFVLDEAVGDYFMWAAADDLQKSSFLDRLVSVLNSNPELVCVMSDVENVDQNLAVQSIARLNDIRLSEVNADWARVRRRFFRNPTSQIFFCIYGLFRTRAIRKVDFNYKNSIKFASASEIPILAQLSLVGRIASISEDLKIYRRHHASIYHEEQSILKINEKLSGFFNVSIVLIDIISCSLFGKFEKVILYLTVIGAGARWIPSFLARLILKPIFVLMRGPR